MQLHPLRIQNSEKTRVRDACEAAPGSVAALAAMVETMALEKRSARQIAAAVRAFADRVASSPPEASVWLASGSPEWRAWEAFYRSTKGRPPPQDKHGGWRFPSRIPPAAA